MAEVHAKKEAEKKESDKKSLSRGMRQINDSNVGARKRKNIRNHSWIINGVIRDAVTSKSKAVDLAILDYKQC